MPDNIISNKVGLITKFSTQSWDEVYKKEAISNLLDRPNGLVKFDMNNARTVRVFKGSLGGMSDYGRNNIEIGASEGLAPRGYAQGAMSGTWESYTVSQDRAVFYPIEKFDDEETDGLALAFTVKESARTVMVPEIDAYNFSKIIKDLQSYALGNVISGNTDNIRTKPLAALNAAYKWLADHEVPEGNQLVFISTAFDQALRTTDELYRRLAVEGSVDKDVSFKIVNYEGRRLVVVPPARFGVTYTKLPHGGYMFPSDDAGIDFIAMDKGAAVHVVKYQKVKVLTGEAALAATNMDSNVVYCRVYHDTFVFDNKAAGIYAHIGGFAANRFFDFGINVNKEGIITNVVEKPAGTLIRTYKTSRSTIPAIGSAWTTDVTTDQLWGEGTAITAAGTYVIVGVVGGQVVACKDLVIAKSGSVYSVTSQNDHTY